MPQNHFLKTSTLPHPTYRRASTPSQKTRLYNYNVRKLSVMSKTKVSVPKHCLRMFWSAAQWVYKIAVKLLTTANHRVGLLQGAIFFAVVLWREKLPFIRLCIAQKLNHSQVNFHDLRCFEGLCLIKTSQVKKKPKRQTICD